MLKDCMAVTTWGDCPAGATAANGSTVPAGVAEPAAPSAPDVTPAAADGTEDGPARKRRRSRWDEGAEDPEPEKH